MPERPRPHVIVVGAGIVGASIAWHLGRTRASVTLVERGRPGAGVTADSFAWITVAHGLDEPYAWLRREAIEEHRRMERDCAGATAVDWCGSLRWQETPEQTATFVSAQRRLGFEVEALEGAAIAEREPALLAPPPLAAWAPREGALDAAAATAALVHAACETGNARLVTGTVTALRIRGERIRGVCLDGQTIDSDVVVVAAGTESADLCASAGVRLQAGASPAILLRLAAGALRLRTIVSSPQLEIRGSTGNGILVAEDHVEGQPPGEQVEAVLATIAGQLRNGHSATFRSLSVGHRPMPGDGLPIVGFAPGPRGLYVAVMHAAVTLAPLIGRLAASEIVDEALQTLLEPFRPDRFEPA
jgi:glycine/D-amino acid oxidase-like deaminating enzyme